MSNSFFLTMRVFVFLFCLIFCLTGSVFRVEYLFVFTDFMLYIHCMTLNVLSIYVHKYFNVKSFYKIVCTTYYSQFPNMTLLYLVVHFLPVGGFSQFINESNSK